MTNRFYWSVLLFLLSIVGCQNAKQDDNQIKDKSQKPSYAIVIHGGAGTITKENMTAQAEAEYLSALNQALDLGETILVSGGTSLEAVQATINYLEDTPLFNAGKGAVFTHDGKNELDASIMEGRNQNAGAVGGVSTIKNPINAAIAVMNHSPHVFMVGEGAEKFVQQQGLELVDPSYFYTEARFQSLQRVLKNEESVEDQKRGTVGCVALDRFGNITAGTSTGGMTNKKYGRVGDSPIIGAGTYADNHTCGVSATGHGEYFIRYTVARDIAALMEYGGKSLSEAADYIVNEKLVEKGGEGGVIALDKFGNIVMPFNTKGMYRGWAKEGEREVLIYE